MLSDSALRQVTRGSVSMNQVLQDALLLHTPGTSDEPVILSIDPSVWPANTRVIDLTQCLNVSLAQTASEADLQRRVVLALQAPDTKRGITAQLAWATP
jgi:hypothetical protein